MSPDAPRPPIAPPEQPAHGAHAAHHHAHAHQGDCDRHHHHAPAPPAPADSLFIARGLNVSRGGRPILEGVDLHISPREIVTLIGPNGAGKTTLVRVILGLEPADSGTVTLKPGIRIGYAPQRFDRDPAIPITVERFVELGARAGRTAIAKVLDEVGAGRVIDRQLVQLSGGELQRVVLARALIRDPALLVLDEPVRGVDYVGEAELYGLIGRIRTERGLGVLLVSHDLHVVMAQSDRVVCLNRHVCCHGVPETVAQHPEYVRLFGASMARAFAVYTHHHDHAHDLEGKPLPPEADSAAPPPRAAAGGQPKRSEEGAAAGGQPERSKGPATE